jgi:hypothetical protein
MVRFRVALIAVARSGSCATLSPDGGHLVLDLAHSQYAALAMLLVAAFLRRRVPRAQRAAERERTGGPR